jgi:hypothetical protein
MDVLIVVLGIPAVIAGVIMLLFMNAAGLFEGDDPRPSTPPALMPKFMKDYYHHDWEKKQAEWDAKHKGDKKSKWKTMWEE